MRGLAILTVVLFTTAAGAQELTKPRTEKEPAYAFMPPTVALAVAMDNKGEITVEVKVTKQVSVIEPVEVIKKVDGKDVKEVVMATKTKSVSIIDHRKYDLAKEGTSITSTDGKPVKREAAIKRLETKTPILISYGPPDPWHLQTTKPDTLILIVPMAVPQPVAPGVPTPPAPVKPKG